MMTWLPMRVFPLAGTPAFAVGERKAGRLRTSGDRSRISIWAKRARSVDASN